MRNKSEFEFAIAISQESIRAAEAGLGSEKIARVLREALNNAEEIASFVQSVECSQPPPSPEPPHPDQTPKAGE